MKTPQKICNELFSATAYIAMANLSHNAASLEIARSYALRLFPKEMVDNAEIELQEKIAEWEKIHINEVRI